jgi:hypothetical protein
VQHLLALLYVKDIFLHVYIWSEAWKSKINIFLKSETIFISFPILNVLYKPLFPISECLLFLIVHILSNSINIPKIIWLYENDIKLDYFLIYIIENISSLYIYNFLNKICISRTVSGCVNLTCNWFTVLNVGPSKIVILKAKFHP